MRGHSLRRCLICRRGRRIIRRLLLHRHREVLLTVRGRRDLDQLYCVRVFGLWAAVYHRGHYALVAAPTGRKRAIENEKFIIHQ